MAMPPPAPLALRTVAITYAAKTGHLRAIRAEVRGLLRDCPIAEDVILCASELAANAVLHSHSSLPGGTLTIRARLSPGHYVRIEVEDNGGSWEPKPSDPERSHGLDIIRALASAWGIDGDHRGRIVWARLDWPGPDSSGV